MRGNGSRKDDLQSVESKVKALTMSLVHATSMAVSIFPNPLAPPRHEGRAGGEHSASLFSESQHC